MSSVSVPAVVLFGDSFNRVPLLLARRTVTPPCCEPPSVPLNVPYCSPDPTLDEDSVIPGALTVTAIAPLDVVGVNPAADTATCVVPAESASKLTPPPASVVGEFCCPGA